MWQSALDYTSPSGYSPASQNSSNFFGNSFSDCDIKMNDSNFSQFQHHLAMSLGGFPFISSAVPTSPNSANPSPHIRAKKKPNPVPADKKTPAYFERRRKNNQSAQKSRDTRRKREADNAAKIKMLENEINILRTINQQLQSQLSCRDLSFFTLQNQQQSQLPNGTSMAMNSIRQQSSAPSTHSNLPLTFNAQNYNAKAAYE
ncbi:BZIP domain-containing protein [Aphelenchoides besseyi]|nr:BZIP domain-containing protein [Aphelenchoides besseyi]KAI6200822.1 BZIP domain-containing protein [Aphelenchoides besseyi]